MLKLNLVPETIKEQMEFHRIYSAVRGMSFIFVFLFIFIAILYIVTVMSLNQGLAYITGGAAVEPDKERAYLNKPREINKQLEQIKNIQSEHLSYLAILKNINNQVLTGINLSNMKINTQDKTLELVGVAETRQDLLDFQKKLEESPLLNNLEMPLQNFLERTMINFSIKSKLDLTVITPEQ